MSAANPPEGILPIDGTTTHELFLSGAIQIFFTGLYSLIFIQASVLLVKQRKGYILGCLTALYISVILNMAMECQTIQTFIHVLEIPFTLPLNKEVSTHLISYGLIQNAVSALAAIIADSLLSWRCYIIWKRNKWILAGSTIIISTEIIFLPIWLKNGPTITFGSSFSFIIFYWVISLVITIISTTLIVYRIINMARKTNTTTPYFPIVEILVESGAMYTIVIIICCALWAQSKPSRFSMFRFGVYEASNVFYSLLIPVTGIAPTLITLRVASGRAREEGEWSQPISSISFRSRGARNDVETLGDSDVTSRNVGRSVGVADAE